jgi:hypothetical protein
LGRGIALTAFLFGDGARHGRVAARELEVEQPGFVACGPVGAIERRYCSGEPI